MVKSMKNLNAFNLVCDTAEAELSTDGGLNGELVCGNKAEKKCTVCGR